MFLRRLFGRKPKPVPPPEVKEFSLESLEEELKSIKKNRLAGVEEAIKPKIEEIAWTCASIKASAKALAKAEVAEEVHARLDKTVQEARRLFIDKVIRAVEGLRPPEELTWQNLISFGESLGRAVNLVTEASATHGRFISILYKHQVQEIYQWIHKLQGLAVGFKSFIDEKTGETEIFDDALSKISRQKEMIEKLKHMHEQKASLEVGAKDLETRVKSKSKELEQMINSKELKQAEEMRRELENIKQNTARLSSEISSAISSLHRPFKKMKRLALDGKHPLDRDKLKMLDLCIEEPLNAFLSDEVNLPRLIALLKEVEKAVESGEVELSPRERRKRLGQIKTMLDGGLLELRRKYEKMLMEKAAKEEAYASSPILKKKAELEKSLEAHRSELKKIQSEFKEISKDIEKIEEEIKRNKSELEDEASTLLGVKLKII
jgi:hypothetical protein